MSTLLESAQPSVNSADTLADLLERLGGISPSRVRLHPAPGTATEADVVAIEAKENRLFELVEGVLVEKGMGYRESILAARILIALGIWVEPRNLGVLTGADGMMRLFPGLVRIPDVAFASWARFPGGKVPEKAVPSLVPDLAVEVLSESNTDAEMERKRGEYFQAGVTLVWIVDPKVRTVAVYTGAEEVVVKREGETVDGGVVLPGFMMEVGRLFAELGAA